MDADAEIDTLLRAALDEDLDARGVAGDVTSALVFDGLGPPAVGSVSAKAAGCISGLGPARRACELLHESLTVTTFVEDGATVAAGDEVLRIDGPAAALMAVERTLLNVLQRLSGVATLTAAFVDRVRGTRARILDTRKTTPGWRQLEKAAVRHGGGKSHRMGLFDEVMLKENHFAIASRPYLDLVADVVARAAERGVPVTAEARDLAEAAACADGGADVILLDNFDVEALAAAVRALESHERRASFELEASGGVDLDTVAAIAATGVDRISVGQLTHSAPALDLSMLIVGRPAEAPP